MKCQVQYQSTLIEYWLRTGEEKKNKLIFVISINFLPKILFLFSISFKLSKLNVEFFIILHSCVAKMNDSQDEIGNLQLKHVYFRPEFIIMIFNDSVIHTFCCSKM